MRVAIFFLLLNYVSMYCIEETYMEMTCYEHTFKHGYDDIEVLVLHNSAIDDGDIENFFPNLEVIVVYGLHVEYVCYHVTLVDVIGCLDEDAKGEKVPLYTLGKNQEQNWQKYLDALEKAGHKRKAGN